MHLKNIYMGQKSEGLALLNTLPSIIVIITKSFKNLEV